MGNPERDLPLSPRELLEHKPGRSFVDPTRPLGDELLEHVRSHGGDPEEGVYGRAPEHYREGHGLPERAKCVAVLRKADELMAENNPPGDTDDNQRRALELACGRCGVRIEEYDHLVDGDPEVKALHALVMEAARLRSRVESGASAEPASVTGR
jgi:hypothetical protein